MLAYKQEKEEIDNSYYDVTCENPQGLIMTVPIPCKGLCLNDPGTRLGKVREKTINYV